AQVWDVELRLDNARLRVRLAVPGLHNVRNALAAAVCAQAAGEPLSAIQQGLEAFRPVKGRSQLQALPWAGHTATLVDDSYNANPDSVLAAIEVLRGLPAPRWLVLGDMGEVGTQGPAFHAEVGAQAREAGLDHLWCVGPLALHAAQAARTVQAALVAPSAPSALSAAQVAVRHFETVDALLAALRSDRPAAGAAQGLPLAASILVKGSRFMRMERVVEALTSGSAAPAVAASAAPSNTPPPAPPAPESPSCC
ncbi:MAG: glutamate ligase domain-containing protein, partial [Rubrivivax sp.]